MPLQENPNLANQQKPRRNSKPPKALVPDTNILSVMKRRSRALLSGPIDLKRQEQFETLPEAPKLPVGNVESSMNMAQVNGLFREQTPTPQEATRPGRVISASMMRSATLANNEPVSSSESIWSSAVGHASTGKSGRVIEKLQAEIDRLRRENQLVKVRFEEVEKANETLAVRNQYLQDRNSNYEASHEANIRQLDRKERQVQDLREDLKKEKEKTARAEEQTRVAVANEETWKDQASQSQAIAQQKETEYRAIVSCRSMDNDRHQGGLDKIKAGLSNLLQQREQDAEKHKKLQIIAEQQRKTIHQLEQLTQKLNSNFKAYRTEIDSAIQGLRETAGKNDENVNSKLREMENVTGQMKWIVNVEHIVNNKRAPPRPLSRHEDEQQEMDVQHKTIANPSQKLVNTIEVKEKHGRKRFSKILKP